jgi:hypothetical protein
VYISTWLLHKRKKLPHLYIQKMKCSKPRVKNIGDSGASKNVAQKFRNTNLNLTSPFQRSNVTNRRLQTPRMHKSGEELNTNYVRNKSAHPAPRRSFYRPKLVVEPGTCRLRDRRRRGGDSRDAMRLLALVGDILSGPPAMCASAGGAEM